jgi:hypothetical protein
MSLFDSRNVLGDNLKIDLEVHYNTLWDTMTKFLIEFFTDTSLSGGLPDLARVSLEQRVDIAVGGFDAKEGERAYEILFGESKRQLKAARERLHRVSSDPLGEQVLQCIGAKTDFFGLVNTALDAIGVTADMLEAVRIWCTSAADFVEANGGGRTIAPTAAAGSVPSEPETPPAFTVFEDGGKTMFQSETYVSPSI